MILPSHTQVGAEQDVRSSEEPGLKAAGWRQPASVGWCVLLLGSHSAQSQRLCGRICVGTLNHHS